MGSQVHCNVLEHLFSKADVVDNSDLEPLFFVFRSNACYKAMNDVLVKCVA